MFSLLVASVLVSTPSPHGFDRSFSKWDALLKDYARGGAVDYRRLRLNGDLEPVLAQFAKLNPDELNGWGKPQKLAFWINAYNAFTMKAVLRLYPIPPRRKCEYPAAYSSSWDPFGCPSNSPARIPEFWKERWYDVAGQKVSLDDIQNQILRGVGETRAMFALSKASMSCPKLRGEAYKADRVLAQLDGDVRRFAEDKSCWEVDLQNELLRASPVLRWYTDWFTRYDDGSFEGYPGDIRGPLAYLSQLLPDYDWTLNDRWKGSE